MTSQFEFQSIVFSNRARIQSIFGSQTVDETTEISVENTPDKVAIVTFVDTSESGRGDSALPDAAMRANFVFGNEPFESFKVYVTITGAPDGAAFALNASGSGTVPPIEINKTTISSDPVSRFISVKSIPDDFESVLTVSYWSNDKEMSGDVTVSVEVDRLTNGDGSPLPEGAVAGERETGADVYGQIVHIPTPVSHRIGTAEMILAAPAP